MLIPSRGSELSYMTLALQREQTAYRLLLMRVGAVLADPEPMLARLVRGCIALAFTAGVRAVATSHRLADPVKGSELSYMTLALQQEPTAHRSLLMRLGAVLADPPGPMLARLVCGCIALFFTTGTVTRHAARMMAQAMAARKQRYKHRNREPIDGKVVGGGPGGGHGHGTPLSTNTVRPGSHLH